MTESLHPFERPESLTAAVTRQIGEAIVRGVYVPGQSLPEVPLASSLGTSRGTVREALRLLTEQGLVEILPHRGAFVSELSVANAREVFTLRAELEAFAVRLALAREGYGPDEVAALEQALADLTAATESGSEIAVAEADMRFHDLVCQASGNQTLLEVLAALRSRARRYIVYTKLVNSDVEPESVTHRRVLEAVLSGDPDRASDAIRHHIASSGDQLVAKLEAYARTNGQAGPTPGERGQHRKA